MSSAAGVQQKPFVIYTEPKWIRNPAALTKVALVAILAVSLLYCIPGAPLVAVALIATGVVYYSISYLFLKILGLREQKSSGFGQIMNSLDSGQTPLFLDENSFKRVSSWPYGLMKFDKFISIKGGVETERGQPSDFLLSFSSLDGSLNFLNEFPSSLAPNRDLKGFLAFFRAITTGKVFVLEEHPVWLDRILFGQGFVTKRFFFPLVKKFLEIQAPIEEAGKMQRVEEIVDAKLLDRMSMAYGFTYIKSSLGEHLLVIKVKAKCLNQEEVDSVTVLALSNLSAISSGVGSISSCSIGPQPLLFGKNVRLMDNSVQGEGEKDVKALVIEILTTLAQKKKILVAECSNNVKGLINNWTASTGFITEFFIPESPS